MAPEVEVIGILSDEWFETDWTDPELFVRTFKTGFRYGYPLCCILALASDGTGTYALQHKEIVHDNGFVPCELDEGWFERSLIPS